MSEWPETNESLILRAKNPQDVAAWRELVGVYRPVVYRMACGRGLQHADAEDLAQGVFVSVTKAIEKWQPSDDGPRFRNWLARITRNAIVNALARTRPCTFTPQSRTPQTNVGRVSLLNPVTPVCLDENRFGRRRPATDLATKDWHSWHIPALQAFQWEPPCESMSDSIGHAQSSARRRSNGQRGSALKSRGPECRRLSRRR